MGRKKEKRERKRLIYRTKDNSEKRATGIGRMKRLGIKQWGALVGSESGGDLGL